MTTRTQLSLFDNPDEPLSASQGIFVPSKELITPPPKVESNAIKKRNKRRDWYLQTVIKKPKGDGPPVA